MKQFFICSAILCLVLVSCKSSKYADLGDGIYADIQTNKGDIVVQLYHGATPVTVANFVSLAEGNSPFVSDEYKEKKYYDGLTFHRVMKDFMIQGGDPLGLGTGNPGYKFKDEPVDSLTHSGKGILSMANSGPKTNGSQFFITHKETPWLNGKHTVFGKVVHGIEVVDSIANVKVLAQNKPEENVVMNHVEIIRNGKEAKKFDAIQIMTDYFAEEEKIIAAMAKMKSDFVAELKEQEVNAVGTTSGLKLFSLKKGEGEQPKIGQQVALNYAGWLMADGTLFDTSEAEIAQKFGNFAQINQMHRGQFSPMVSKFSPEAPLAPGFREGMLTMRVGDKVRLFIPPHLGYGDNDYGPIPGGSTLVFDLEMVNIQ
ncbi:peptidylprolyl isomerase [Croceitalea rosinachiae]|uniref:peptidylprolyl isomerase n=1 Tax=Croceitalea rosinachiae TaxID=3075596 RepID=A0ABU3A9W9_9FLAO|nr:peptidylprolyl isomerase [Croceitalea sp. F388]MDT0606987.1 peptidylprolyl isomerase [Croceitalea sp. F388]